MYRINVSSNEPPFELFVVENSLSRGIRQFPVAHLMSSSVLPHSLPTSCFSLAWRLKPTATATAEQDEPGIPPSATRGVRNSTLPEIKCTRRISGPARPSRSMSLRFPVTSSLSRDSVSHTILFPKTRETANSKILGTTRTRERA